MSCRERVTSGSCQSVGVTFFREKRAPPLCMGKQFHLVFARRHPNRGGAFVSHAQTARVKSVGADHASGDESRTKRRLRKRARHKSRRTRSVDSACLPTFRARWEAPWLWRRRAVRCPDTPPAPRPREPLARARTRRRPVALHTCQLEDAAPSGASRDERAGGPTRSYRMRAAFPDALGWTSMPCACAGSEPILLRRSCARARPEPGSRSLRVC